MENPNGAEKKEEKVETAETSESQEQDDGARKKRGARIQLTSDNPEESSDEEAEKQEVNSSGWKKAQAEVIAQRRIVKVRRGNSSAIKPENDITDDTTEKPAPQSAWPKFDFSSTTNSSPFATLAALSSQTSTTTKSDETTKEVPTEVGTFTLVPKEGETTSTASSSTSTSSSSTSSAADSTTSASSSTSSSATSTNLFSGASKFDYSFNTSPVFGFNIAPPKAGATPSSFAGIAAASTNNTNNNDNNNNTSNGNSSTTAAAAASTTSAESSTAFSTFGVPSALPKVTLPAAEPVQTGEEDEDHIFQNRAKLFVLDAAPAKAEGSKEEESAANAGPKWRERGVGSFRVNVKRDKSQARMLMRVEGSLRLVLNARIWPSMKVEKVGEKQLRFTATSMEKEGELCCYLVRFGSPQPVDDLVRVIENAQRTANKI